MREDAHGVPGALALDALRRLEVAPAGLHAFVVGEQALATGGRRLLVDERGVDRGRVSFVGFWRVGVASPAPAPAREAAARAGDEGVTA